MKKIKTWKQQKGETYEKLEDGIPKQDIAKRGKVKSEKGFYDEMFEQVISGDIINRKIEGHYGLQLLELLKFLEAEKTLGHNDTKKLIEEMGNSSGAIPILNKALFSLDNWNSSNYEKLLDEKIGLMNDFIEQINKIDRELDFKTNRLNLQEIPKIAKLKLREMGKHFKSEIKKHRNEKIRLHNHNEMLKKDVKRKIMYEFYKQWHEETMNMGRVKRIYYDDTFKVDKPELYKVKFDTFSGNFRKYKSKYL